MSIESAKQAVAAAEAAERSASNNKRQAMAALLREQLLEMIDQFPTITGVCYRSSWEYDDESSYYWWTSLYALPEDEDHGTVDPYQYTVHDYFMEKLCERGDDFVEACKILFGSDDPEYGEISASELR